MHEQRRAFQRTRYYGEVELDGMLKASLVDLSPDGAFIDSRTVPPPGTVVQLRFLLHGREIETGAEVRYTSPGIGMGVKFVGLDPALRAEIGRLLARGEADGEPSLP